MEVQYAQVRRMTENFPRHLARTLNSYRGEMIGKICEILENPPVSPTDLAYVFHILMDCPDPEGNTKVGVETRYKICEIFWKFFSKYHDKYCVSQQYRLLDCLNWVLSRFHEKDFDKVWENQLDVAHFKQQCADYDEEWRNHYKDVYGRVFNDYTPDNKDGIVDWNAAYPSSRSSSKDIQVHCLPKKQDGKLCPYAEEIDMEFDFELVELRQKLSAKLCTLLEWRPLVDQMIREMTKSIRKDEGYGDSKRRALIQSLGRLIHTVGRFQKHSTTKAQAEKMIQRLTCVLGKDEVSPIGELESSEKISIVYCRLMIMLLPSSITMEVIKDQRLFTWWGFLAEGRLNKFDLMWFKFLARYSKARWCNQNVALKDAAPEGVMKVDPADVKQCESVISDNLPWLVNKILRSLQLPSFSPVANSLQDSGVKLEHVNPFERLRLPSEVDSLMGGTSTWKFVAKFIIFQLEPTPFPGGSDGMPLYWKQLELIVRRMRPYVQPGSRGEWTWHCATLVQHFCQQYFARAARERVSGATVKIDQPLSLDADTHFQYLFMPLLRNMLKSRDQTEQATAMDCIPRLGRLMSCETLKLCEASSNIEEGGADPAMAIQEMDSKMSYPLCKKFDMEDTLYTQTRRQMEILMDPEQSGRATSVFRFFSKIVPSIIKFFPQQLPDMLDSILLGIDPTDAAKTLASSVLLVNIFSVIPCVSIDDLPTLTTTTAGAARAKKLKDFNRNEAWVGLAVGEDKEYLKSAEEARRASAMQASTRLSEFALNYFEKTVQYIKDTILDGGNSNKTGRIVNAGQAMDKLNSSLIFICNFLVLNQSSKFVQEKALNIIAQFLEKEIYPQKTTKVIKSMVHAVSRCQPERALKTLIPILQRRMERNKEIDTEVRYCLDVLGAVIRFSGPEVCKYKEVLDDVLFGPKKGLNFWVSPEDGKVNESQEKRMRGVHKIAAKLLRRLLETLSSTYIISDVRCVDEQTWKTLSQEEALFIWGANPWWRATPLRPPQWSYPTKEMLDWAIELGVVCMLHTLELVSLNDSNLKLSDVSKLKENNPTATMEAASTADAEPAGWNKLNDDVVVPCADVHPRTTGEFLNMYKTFCEMKDRYVVSKGGLNEKSILMINENSDKQTELQKILKSSPFFRCDRILSFVKAIFRGGNNLWADELSERKICVSAISLPVMFDALSVSLRFLLEMDVLGSNNAADVYALSPEAATTAAAAKDNATKGTPAIVTKKVLRCIDELWSQNMPCNSGCLFRTKKSNNSGGNQFLAWYTSLFGEKQISQMFHTHKSGQNRDVPRIWWTQKICVELDTIAHERLSGGYGYAGERKKLTEVLLELSWASHFPQIRERAQGLLAVSARKHHGAKSMLASNYLTKVDVLIQQWKLLMRQIDVSDDQKKAFNNQLNAFSFAVGGTLRIIFAGLWRGKGKLAAVFAYRLVELLYHLSMSHQSNKEVVKSTSLQRMFVCVDSWLENRDRPCKLPLSKDKCAQRSPSIGLGSKRGSDDEEDDTEPLIEHDACLQAARQSGQKGVEGVVNEAKTIMDQLSTKTPWRMRDFLEILSRSEGHWRLKVTILSVCQALAQQNGNPLGLWQMYFDNLIPFFHPNSQQGLLHITMRSLAFALREHPQLVTRIPELLVTAPTDEKVVADIKSKAKDPTQEKWLTWWYYCIQVVPRLHHSSITKEVGSDPTRQTVEVLRNYRPTGMLPCTWQKSSTSTFAQENCIFWHTLFAAMLKYSDMDTCCKCLELAAEYCTDQPLSEVIYKVGLAEMAGGVLRAARKEEHFSVVWHPLHQHMRSEITNSAMHIFVNWLDSFRYIMSSTRITMSNRQHDWSTVIGMVNFALRLDSEALPDFSAITSYNPDEVEFDHEAVVSEASSLTQVKKLKFFNTIIAENTQTVRAIDNADSASANKASGKNACLESVYQYAKGRLAHPYKSLRDEAGRTVSLIMRNIRAESINSNKCVYLSDNLQTLGITIAKETVETANRLEATLRADVGVDNANESPARKQRLENGAEAGKSGASPSTAAAKTDEDLKRKPHVVEALGLISMLVHDRIGKRHHINLADVLEFMLTASVHIDVDLRQMGWISLLQASVMTPPARLLDDTDIRKFQGKALQSGLNKYFQAISWSDRNTKQKEKIMLFSALVILANTGFYVNNDELKQLCVQAGERGLLEGKPDVKTAAKRYLTGLFLIEDLNHELLSRIPKYAAVARNAKAMASGAMLPTPSPSETPTIGAASAPDPNLQAAQCLVMLLYVAMDLGCPKEFTGSVIDALSPFANARKFPQVILKEVQNAFQSFLKHQQSSPEVWQECKRKLTTKQLDAVESNKGKLSYFC